MKELLGFVLGVLTLAQMSRMSEARLQSLKRKPGFLQEVPTILLQDVLK